MRSVSSGIITTRRNRMPSCPSVLARTARFSSCTLPLRSSLPTMSAAAVFRAPSSPIELRLEGTRHRFAIGVDAEQLFDSPFGAVEPLLRDMRKPNPLFEKPERCLEGQVTALELLDDLSEAPDSVLEGDVIGRRAFLLLLHPDERRTRKEKMQDRTSSRRAKRPPRR